MKDNPVLDLLMSRASIRRYKSDDVPTDLVEAVVRAGRQAPFTGQMYSVIATRDPEKRAKLPPLLGHLATAAPVFFLLCMDLRKLEKFVVAGGGRMQAADLSLLFWGIQDVAYVGENMVIAAESLGLGTCFLGSAPWVSRQLAELFDLPERVYPIVGMVMGYPAERPPVRPRLPLRYVLHWDGYRDLSRDDVDAALEVMDAELIREGYYHKYDASADPGRIAEDYGWREHLPYKYGNLPRDLRDLLAALSEGGIDLIPRGDGRE